jgi:hypothetical protein
MNLQEGRPAGRPSCLSSLGKSSGAEIPRCLNDRWCHTVFHFLEHLPLMGMNDFSKLLSLSLGHP